MVGVAKAKASYRGLRNSLVRIASDVEKSDYYANERRHYLLAGANSAWILRQLLQATIY